MSTSPTRTKEDLARPTSKMRLWPNRKSWDSQWPWLSGTFESLIHRVLWMFASSRRVVLKILDIIK